MILIFDDFCYVKVLSHIVHWPNQISSLIALAAQFNANELNIKTIHDACTTSGRRS